MVDSNILDQIFAIKENEVETFADVINMGEQKFCPNELLRLKKTSNFKVERQKNIEINHGNHEDNYVWHIKPWHPKRPWAVSIERVVYAIAVILHEMIPHDVQIETFLPALNWEIEEITIKAYKALTHWSLQEEDFSKITGQMFEILNALT